MDQSSSRRLQAQDPRLAYSASDVLQKKWPYLYLKESYIIQVQACQRPHTFHLTFPFQMKFLLKVHHSYCIDQVQASRSLN